MDLALLISVATDASGYFWSAGQGWVIGLGLSCWLLLHALLPQGSRHALRQTGAIFVFCLAGELIAAVLHAFGWQRVAEGFFEAALIGVGLALIRFAGLILFRIVLPRLAIETPRILEDIVVMVGYCVWGLVRLRYAGLDLSQIVATSAVMTAIIAFAMQDTLGNILGGLAIHLDHSVEIGDWVVVDGVGGRVVDIRWRHTKIATRNGEKVVVPNGVLMKNKFTVIGVYGGATNAWRRWVWFNVDLAHPPARVIETVETMLANAEIANVAREPRPNCVLMEFGAGFGRYAVRYWLTDPQVDDPTDSAVRIHVLVALQRAGMRLAIAEEARHIIKENEAHSQVLAARELQRRLDALGDVEMFRGLTGEERALLAGYLAHSPFARGDLIMRQGSVAHWLYILVAGEVEVWLDGDGGERRLLSTIPAGSVFGEMGLLTGEPRRATVIAKSDVDCYRLDKAGLEEIMRDRPAIAEEISRILAAREAELEQTRQDLGEAAAARRRAEHHRNLLGRIRSFFRLG